ncbi:tumor necrosis factor receptor superfamily member 13C isoform X1 [Chroicocephalus ridibundus]|uniref:tumor necrosis factor receptor superfamily member 13C isoform X1 n=1 Tax=Chroicocephalus ridibundus TaxID=1192867 RepID=UPI002FDDF1D4
MGGNRVRSVTTMRLQHPSTQQDPGARYLQEDITAAIPGLPTKHLQLQVFTPAEPARMAPTSPLVPTLPSVDLPSTLLIFGVPAVVGLILALAALWGFLACKVGKQRRKRKAADEEAKANTDAASPLPEPGCQDAAVPEGDAILATAPCPHHNGGLKMAGPPGKAGAKRRPCCQGDADGDIILLSAVYSQHEECNHSFPLPATELGATALVTTKTTQNCSSEERA